MKLLLESWRDLTEATEQLPQIYCDMDGVLVDFEAGVVEQINKDLDSLRLTEAMERTEKQEKDLLRVKDALDTFGKDRITIEDLRGKTATSSAVRKYMYARVGNDADFWAHLPWMPGGRELWAFIAPYKPFILTSPMNKGSEIGKAFWIDEHLGPDGPEEIHMDREKYKWATDSDGSQNILIDDWAENTIPWESAGGIAIQHIDGDAGATIATLKKLGFGESE